MTIIKSRSSKKSKKNPSNQRTTIVSGSVVLVSVLGTGAAAVSGVISWSLALHILVHFAEMLFYGASLTGLMFSLSHLPEVKQRWITLLGLGIVVFAGYTFFNDWQDRLPQLDDWLNAISTFVGLFAFVLGWGGANWLITLFVKDEPLTKS